MKCILGICAVAAVLVSTAMPRAAFGQASQLEADLKSQYKTTRFAVSGGQVVPTDQGAVLVVRRAGIRAFPPNLLIIPMTKFQDNRIDTPKENPFLGPNKLLPVDTRVYVMKVSIDAKKDRVLFLIVECDACNGVQQPSFYKAQVAFQFPQGYLQGADAGQVGDVISQLLAPENGGDGNGQGGDGGQGDQNQQGGGNGAGGGGNPQYPPQQGPPDPPKQTQTIEKGQTEDQVLSILGQPDKIVNLGAKKLYVYKDLKITFIGGKVADVQ